MADDEDYEGGDMDGDEFMDEEPVEDLDLEQPAGEEEEAAGHVQVVDVRILISKFMRNNFLFRLPKKLHRPIALQLRL